MLFIIKKENANNIDRFKQGQAAEESEVQTPLKTFRSVAIFIQPNNLDYQIIIRLRPPMITNESGLMERSN